MNAASPSSRNTGTSESATPASGPPNTAHRGWILLALMLTMALAAMDITIVATAVPQIVGDLGDFNRFSWLFSIYLLAQTATIPVYGKLADLYGRKPVLIGGALLFLAGSAACASAWSMLTLIIFRGIQGLGAGSIMATVNTLAGDLYAIEERGRVQGWLSSVWGIAAIVGPTLGGAFAEYASWHWVFLVNLPIGAVALTLIARYLHEEAPQHRHTIDYAGAVLMMLAGSAMVFALLQGGNAWAWSSMASLLSFGVAFALIAATVLCERRAAEPIMPGWVWRHPALLGANLGTLGMGLIMMAPNTYLPVFAQSVLGLGAIAAGLVLASMSIGWVGASAWSARLYMRFGFRNTALFGAVLMLSGTLGFIILPPGPPTWAVLLDQILLGTGFGMLSTPLLVCVQSIVPWNQRGVATGTNMWSRYLGQSLGAAIAGVLFNTSMIAQLQSAPAGLVQAMPHVDDVVHVLQTASLGEAAQHYLLRAFDLATHQAYNGMAWVALATLLAILIVPRKITMKN